MNRKFRNFEYKDKKNRDDGNYKVKFKDFIDNRLSRFWKYKYYVLFIFIAITTSLVGYFYFDIFRVNHFDIEIEDSPHIESEVVLDFLNEEYLKENFIVVGTEVLADELQSEFKYIREVEVKKEGLGTLKLDILVRKPSVLVVADNSCAVLDYDRHVFESLDLNSTDQDLVSEFKTQCLSLQSNFDSLTLVEDESTLSQFQTGVISNYYTVEEMVMLQRLFDSYNYEIDKVLVTDDRYEVISRESETFVFSRNVDFETQIKRFILVVGELPGGGFKFERMDLRFERPVVE